MVRFGIVGASGIAQKFARDIKLVENAKISAVSARNSEQAKIYQKMYETEYAFSSYEEMAKSDAIDAVYIAVPHNFHCELALLFMKNRKHVLVEKPLGVNQREYEKMFASSRENKVLLMEAMWTHFLPSTAYVKKIIDSNILGKLKEAEIEFGYNLVDNYPKTGRLLNKELAGGSLLDLGIYPVSFYNLIRQAEIKEIQASAEFTNTGVDLETEIIIIDEFDAKITMRSSLNTKLDNDAFLVYEFGDIKMIDFHRSVKVFINNQELNIPFEGEGFVPEIKSFVESITNGEIENKISTFKRSLESIKILDETRKLIGLKYPFE